MEEGRVEYMAWCDEGPKILKSRMNAGQRKGYNAAEVVADFGHWPSTKEVAEKLGVTLGTAQRWLQTAESMGLVSKGEGYSYSRGRKLITIWIAEEP